MTASHVSAKIDLTMPLARRAELLATGALDPAGYRDQLAEHIAALEPRVTAFAGRGPGDLDNPALPGAPSVTYKDTIDVAGYPTGLGIRSGYARWPHHSAGIARRLAARGWVCVGKVSTTECALGTVKPSRNPAYPHVSTAGSSTGSAVAVAAGFCDVSVGSDSGGSLRWPAVYCGITALRFTPRPDLLPGVHAVAPSMESVGLVTRTVADLDWLWRAYDLAAVTGAGSIAVDTPRFVISAPAREPLHPEVAKLLARVRAALAGRGHRVTVADLPAVWDDRGAAAELLAREAHDSFAELAAQPDVRLGPDTHHAIMHGAGVTDARYATLLAGQREAADRLATLLTREHDVLVMPLEAGLPDRAPAVPSPEHGGDVMPPLGGGPAGVNFALVASFARLPVLALPLALSSERSPLGVQLLAAPGNEDLLRAAGLLLETIGRSGELDR